MIFTIIFNGFALCVICVGCDYVVTPIIARHKLTLTRTEVATALCFGVTMGAYLIRGLPGMVEVSSLAIIAPTYVHLTQTTTAPINLKLLLTKIWERIKNFWQWLLTLK